MKGKFIVLEGIDGSGKTTQLNELYKWLPKSGLISENSKVIQTRDPGGTVLGKKIRQLLLEKDIRNSPAPLTELLLYSADRSEHLSTIILPALNNNDWVISDRFSDSTLAYQGYGRNINIEIINKLELLVCQGKEPDITFFLDISAEESIKRRKNEIPDRMESEGLRFLEKVNNGFRSIAKEKNWEIISASKDQSSIAREIQSVLIKKFTIQK